MAVLLASQAGTIKINYGLSRLAILAIDLNFPCFKL